MPLPNDQTSTTAADADCASAPSAVRRAPSRGRPIDAARIEAALKTVAILLGQNELYLPIFLRLEAELEAARVTSSALDRARALAAKAGAR